MENESYIVIGKKLPIENSNLYNQEMELSPVKISELLSSQLNLFDRVEVLEKRLAEIDKVITLIAEIGKLEREGRLESYLSNIIEKRIT